MVDMAAAARLQGFLGMILPGGWTVGPASSFSDPNDVAAYVARHAGADLVVDGGGNVTAWPAGTGLQHQPNATRFQLPPDPNAPPPPPPVVTPPPAAVGATGSVPPPATTVITSPLGVAPPTQTTTPAAGGNDTLLIVGGALLAGALLFSSAKKRGG